MKYFYIQGQNLKFENLIKCHIMMIYKECD